MPVEWPKDGDGCRWDCRPEHPVAAFVLLQGIGHVRVHRHRRVLGTVKTISVKREGSRWFVVLSCEGVPAGQLPGTGAAVGLDMGVASLVTTSDGVHVANPRHLGATAARLAAAQRDLARKRRGSRRRRTAVAGVAVLQAKVRRGRLDSPHKAAPALVRDYDVIVHEDLKIANMTRSASDRSILDAGWGVFLQVLAYKAASAGRELIAVDPRDTSRTCAECGHCAKENRVTQAEFACQACGHTAHAGAAEAAWREAASFMRRRSHSDILGHGP
ncbi:RNA-guided endonuclease InsQ/TnpB family protein [Nonomuraea lactucae]|uniref:RNA-guided endonuclease InsQ/TnpB family protein n=1 Tax=Nonomuraea lactucae TaxID=2249762 RepID=UPI001F05DA54|nr:transposase [Nonomuraea lactucae]